MASLVKDELGGNSRRVSCRLEGRAAAREQKEPSATSQLRIALTRACGAEAQPSGAGSQREC
jgi:hypothetical protein